MLPPPHRRRRDLKRADRAIDDDIPYCVRLAQLEINILQLSFFMVYNAVYFQHKPWPHHLKAIRVSFCNPNPTVFLNLTEPLEQTKNNHWKQKHGHRPKTLVSLRTANLSSTTASFRL